MSRERARISDGNPTALQGRRPRVSRLSQVALVCLVVLSTFMNVPQTAWSTATSNSTQIASSTQSVAQPNLTTVNLTTGAVVTFVIVLLGLAAAILVMGRFLIPKSKIAGRP